MKNAPMQQRLVDYFNLNFNQDDVDFAIPQLEIDIRLSIDPFLLWSSKNPIYLELHKNLLNFFENIRQIVLNKHQIKAIQILLKCGEPRELGLGFAKTSKRGSSIGRNLASDIVGMYEHIPQITQGGLNHIEAMQLVIPNIAADRVSDITYSILKKYFIDFTEDRAKQYNIPTKPAIIEHIFDHDRMIWTGGMKASLPYNPMDNSPIVFAPLDILRHLPWINYEDYYSSVFSEFVLRPNKPDKDLRDIRISKAEAQAINRRNYGHVEYYIDIKEKQAEECKPQPLTERIFLEQNYRAAQRLLAILQQQAAKFTSLYMPAPLQLELEDQQEKVKYWDTKLRELEDNKI